MKSIYFKLGVLLATLLFFPIKMAFAVPILSKVVWSYDVTPNSLRVDRPGRIFPPRSGRFTQPKQFGVSFGLYNFTSQPISITGITFDFWEEDGLEDDPLVDNLVLNLPQPFFLEPTNVSFGINVTSTFGGEVSNFGWDPRFNLPSAAKTPFYNFSVSASDLNKGTDSTFDKWTVEFSDASNILLRPLRSVTDIKITARAVPEPSTILLLSGGLLGWGLFRGIVAANIALKRDGRYRARPLALLQGLPQIFNRRRVFISSLHSHLI